MNPRFVLSLAACCLSLTAANADEYAVTDDWSIQISPAVKIPANGDVVIVNDADGTAAQTTVNASDYARIYQSIPFNRAEYNANPSYRHDSAMEILTGNARHQTIVRHDAPRPVATVPPVQTVPYRYNNRRWGLNYYFYFPYWNYRGLY